MLIETDVQTIIIKAVRAHGGAAHKLSNRFLVGVADLLIKQPKFPATLMEVKLTKFSLKTMMHDYQFKLNVSHLQRTFLRTYAAAGMSAGVLSALLIGNQHLRLACFNLDVMDRVGYTATIGQHLTDGRKPEEINRMLELFHHG